MQRNRTLALLGFAAAAAIALPGSAEATGARRYQGVLINLAGTYATGAIGQVHNVGGGTNYIGCYSTGTRTYVEGDCYARDDSGQFASCWTREPNLVNAIASINSDSLVTFAWTSGGECYNLTFATDSRDAPRVP